MTPHRDSEPGPEPELLRHAASLRALALALLRDPGAADDAVQDTFVQALGKQGVRSRGGWLAAVVRNFARQRRRADARRLERERAAARSEAVPAADVVAARREMLMRLVEAVHALPEPYRETVWQRYFEELSPAVIAQRGGVPLATVKSRLQRGLSMLRERLDRDGEGGEWRRGLATAFGIGSGVRVGAAAAAGVLLMGTAAKVVLGGVVVAAAAVLWWATYDPLPRVLPLAQDPTLEPVAASAAPEDHAPSAERTELAAAEPDRALTPATLRGRCVDEDGAPLAGCSIVLSSQRGVGFASDLQWQPPAPFATGADGTFEFHLRPPVGVGVSLVASIEGRAPRSGYWRVFEPRAVIEVGDIVMRRGFVVGGTVVDESGRPLAHGQLGLSTFPVLAPPQRGYNGAGAKVAEDGSFTFSSPIPAGEWPLSFHSQDGQLVSPGHVTVDPVLGAAPLRVVVRALSLPRLEGIVIDEQGAPVAWVPVLATQDDGRTVGTAMSGRDGRFSIVAESKDAQPARIGPDQVVIPGARLCQLARRDTLHAWGSTDVCVVVRRPLTCELTVVERGTGKPVTRFGVRCYPDAVTTDRPVRLAGEHPDGRVTLTNIWPGPNSLRVVPADGDLVPSARIAFEAGQDGAAPMRVELERTQPATVRVTTAEGAPLAGVKVEVIAPGTVPIGLDQYIFEPRADMLPSSSNLDHRFPEPRSAAMTDADGRAEVLVSDGTETLAVRVRDGGTPLVLVQPAHFLPGQQLDVVVPKAGSIVGVVHMCGGSQPGFLMACWRSGERPPQRDDGVRLQGDGSFSVRGLTAGSYCLQLRRVVSYRTGPGSELTTIPVDVAIRAVDVEAGQESRVDVDASAVSPASVHGRVLLDGVAPTAAHVFLRNPDFVRFGQFFVDGDGRFAATDVLPGSYRVGLVLGDPQNGAEMLPMETIVLAAGQDLQRDFVFAHRVLEVRIVGADGVPVGDLYCTFEADGFYKSCRTDAEGRGRLDPAPEGTVRVTAVRDGRGAVIGEVAVPLGKTEHKVTLMLPAK